MPRARAYLDLYLIHAACNMQHRLLVLSDLANKGGLTTAGVTTAGVIPGVTDNFEMPVYSTETKLKDDKKKKGLVLAATGCNSVKFSCEYKVSDLSLIHI